MKVRSRALLSAAMSVALVLQPPAVASASAASQQDWDGCNQSDDLDLMINSCTRILNNKREDRQSRANAHNKRGVAWGMKGANGKAFADFSAALRLNPKFAPAYYNRGNAWISEGDNERAIAAYSNAIKINPKHVAAYSNRGLAWARKGDSKRALADYTKLIEIDPQYRLAFSNRGVLYFTLANFPAASDDFLRASDLDDRAFDMIWRFIARARAGQDGGAELDVNAARLKTKEWPYAVIEFYRGERSLAEFQAEAEVANKRCEANFHSAEWYLLKNDFTSARSKFQVAIDICPKTSKEYRVAISELKRLKIKQSAAFKGELR